MEFTEIETALADKPEILAEVKSLHERAGKFTPEIEAEVGKLTEYKGHSEAYAKLLKETGAKDVDGLIKDFGNLKSSNADLVKQRDTWKANGKGASSPEYLALEEKIAEGTRKLEEITGKMTAAETAAATAQAEKRESDLKASVVAAAGKMKAVDPEEDLILLKAKGLTGHDENGTPYFYKLNDAGQKVAVNSADEMVAAYYAKRPDRLSASGVTGTGGRHTKTEGGNVEMTAKEAVAALRARRQSV